MYSQSPLNELAPRFDTIVQPQTRKMHPIEQLLFNENFQPNSSPERFYSSNSTSNNVSSLAQNSIFSPTGVQPQQQPTQRSFGSFGVVGSNTSSTSPSFFPLPTTSTNSGATAAAYAHYRSPPTLSSLGGNSFSPIHTSSPQQRKQSNNPIFSQQRLPLFQQQSMNDTSEELNMDYNEEFIYNMGGMEDIDNSPTAVQALNQQTFPNYQQQQQQQIAYQRSAMGGNQFVDFSSQQQPNLYQVNPHGSHHNGSYDSSLERQLLYQQQMAVQQKYLRDMNAKSIAMNSRPQTIQQAQLQQQQQQQMYVSTGSFAEGQGPYHQLRKEVVLGQNQPKNSFVEYSSPVSSMVLNNFEAENESLELYSDPGDKSFSPLSTSPSSTGLGSHSSSQLGSEHPLGEHPSRTLFVRNISSSLEDDYLKNLFESYGEIRSIYTQTKHRGFVMISYYDIRHAKNAMKNLQHKIIRKRKIDIHYSIPKDNPNEKDMNQGTLVIFNLDPSITNEDLKKVFGKFGEIKEIRETPNKKHHKFIEFYDVRDADKAMKTLNKTELRGKKIKIEPSRPGGARRTLLQQQLQQQNLMSSSMDESHLISYNVGFPNTDTLPKDVLLESGHLPALDDFPTSSTSLPSQLYTNFQQFGLYSATNVSSSVGSLGSTSTTPAFLSGNSSNVTSPILASSEENKKKKSGELSYSSSLPTTEVIGSYESETSLGSPKSFAQVLQNSIKADQGSVSQELKGSSSSSPVTVVATTTTASNTKTKNRTSSNASGKNAPTFPSISSSDDKKKFLLDLDKVRQGIDKRTTLMVKNIPNKYTQKMILETIDVHFKGKYDFFYLPIDFKNKCNVGYAFINFVVPESIIPFVEEFNNKKWEKFNSEKVCDISYARLQGRIALINHFNNSSLMVEDETMRPVFN